MNLLGEFLTAFVAGVGWASGRWAVEAVRHRKATRWAQHGDFRHCPQCEAD